MIVAYVVVTLLTVVAVGVVAAADLVPARFVLANSAAVGVPTAWLTPLGLRKGAGAAGLLAGLLSVPLIGPAAAVGLVAFFVGAVAAHLRAGIARRRCAFHRLTLRSPSCRWLESCPPDPGDFRPLEEGRKTVVGASGGSGGSRT